MALAPLPALVANASKAEGRVANAGVVNTSRVLRTSAALITQLLILLPFLVASVVLYYRVVPHLQAITQESMSEVAEATLSTVSKY